MTIKPAFNNILLKMIDARASEGNLILPDTAKPIMPYGLVLGIGSSVQQIKVDDKVIFDPERALRLPVQDIGSKDIILLLAENYVDAFYVEE